MEQEEIEMISKNSFKSGDKVRYKDNDSRVFRVHTIYDNTHVSLGLADYPEIEQDYRININEIVKLKENRDG
jgi:hypothetical protein